MAENNVLVHRYNAGEVSRAALSRVDQERIRLNAERQENIFPYVIGKGLYRPGTRYLVDGYNNERTRLVPFVKSIGNTAILEFGNEVMRVLVNRELVTRPAVTSTVSNGDFASSTNWTLTASTGATSSIASNTLTLYCPARGSSASAKQNVLTSSSGTEHALRIRVTFERVTFECGSTDGADDLIERTTLEVGYHSLAFTPSTSSYWIKFSSTLDRSVVVSSVQVESAGVMELTTPWTTSNIRRLRYDQSLDVLFMADGVNQQRRIERRNSGRSWSSVRYWAEDGPYALTPALEEKIKITPSAAYGTVTLTASADLFESTDVGGIYKLTSSGANAMFQLAALDVYTEPVRLSGIGTDNDFSVVTTGTWTATLSLQRSIDGPDSGYTEITTITTNATTNVATGTEYDNVIAYYRVGVKAYTSGTANVQIVAGSVSGGSGASDIVTTGVYRIRTVASSTSATATVLKHPVSISGTTNWQRGDWSDRRGWPSATAFYDGRLWWGRLDRFWGSVSGNYHSMSVDVEGDSASIQRDVATGGTHAEINWLLPLQRLIFGTTGAEVSARSSSFDEPLTPTNLTLRDASTVGSARVPSVKVDGRGIYVQRSGRRIYEIVYSYEANDYASYDLTRYHEELCLSDDPAFTAGIVDLAIQRQPETYIWAIRDDGICPIMIYNPKEEVMGWFKFIAGEDEDDVGQVQSVACLPTFGEDEVYMIVKRVIGGTAQYYIELLVPHLEASGSLSATNNLPIWKLADCHTFAAGPARTIAVPQLAGQTVIAMGCDASGNFRHYGEFEVESDNIELDEDGYNVTVGLPYEGIYKSSKLAYGAQKGTAVSQVKRVSALSLVIQDTHPDALTVGSDFDDAEAMSALPRVENGVDIDEDTFHSMYDEQMFPFDSQFDTDARFCARVEPGYPATLTGLVLAVDTREK